MYLEVVRVHSPLSKGGDMPEPKIGWKSHAYHATLLVASFTFCVYWFFHLPKSGKALLVLGGVAALMLLADLHPNEVSVAVVDIDWMKQVIAGKPSLSYGDIQSFTVNFPIIPFLTPGTSQMLTRIPIGARPRRNLQITFSSLNGIWSETLKLELINGQWAQALRVGKVVSPVRGGTPNEKLTTPLYTFATDNFPKKDGKVDWDN